MTGQEHQLCEDKQTDEHSNANRTEQLLTRPNNGNEIIRKSKLLSCQSTLASHVPHNER